MNLRLLDEKYVRDKKLLEDKYDSDFEAMKKILLKELSIYVSKKYFNDIIEMKVNYRENDETYSRIDCFKNLERDGEKLGIYIYIYIYYSTVEIHIVIRYIDNDGYKIEFEGDDTSYKRETLCNELHKSAFVDLAPILDKFITNDYYIKVGKDIYRYFRILYDTDYLHNLPKATTFYLCSKIFPRDIAKIIYKKILFFLIVS